MINFTANRRKHVTAQPKEAAVGMDAYLTGNNVIWMVMILNLVFGCAYLLMLNSLSTQAFGLEGFKSEKLTLQKEMESIDIALAIPSSLYALQSNEVIQSLPNISRKNKIFVEIPSSELAFLQQ